MKDVWNEIRDFVNGDRGVQVLLMMMGIFALGMLLCFAALVIFG